MPYGIEKIPSIAKSLGRIASGTHKIRPYQIPSMVTKGRPVTLTTKAIRPSGRTLHNFFGEFKAYWPGSEGKTGRAIPVTFSPQTGLPTNPPRMPTGELVGMPWRNFGDDMSDMLINGVTKMQDNMRTVVNPVSVQGKRIRKLIGNDSYDILIKNAGGQRQAEHVKLMGKLQRNPAVLGEVKKFETIYGEMLDPIRGYLKSVGHPFYKKGKYVPESFGEYYKILTPRNLDELIKANKGLGRGVTAKDIMSSGMEVRGSFGTYNLAKDFLDKNKLINRAVIWPESHISSKIEAAFTDPTFANWLTDIAHGKVNPALIGEKVHSHIRNVISEAMRTGTMGKTPFAPGFLPKHNMTTGKIFHTPESIDHYARSMYRKMGLDEPAKFWGEQIRHNKVFTGNPEFASYAEDILNRTLGVPSPTLTWLADHLIPLGIDERKLRSLFTTSMQVQAMLKIGANPLLPLVNATQIFINTGSLLGFKYVGQGYEAVLTNRTIGGMTARAWIKHGGYTWKHVGDDVPKILAGLQNMSSPTVMSKVNNYSLRLFTMVEMNHNRGVSFVSALIKGEKMGLIGKDLEKFAHGVVRTTQFPYGSASQPWIFGPISNIPLQFKTYFVHQIDFLTQLTKQALVGARTGQPELAYPLLRAISAYGVLGGIGALPFNNYFMERSKKLNELALKHPVLFRGAPGLAGYDISRRLDLNFPDPSGHWLSFFIGPTLSDLTNLGRAWPEFTKGRYGEMMERAVRGFSPAISSIRGSLGRDSQGQYKMDSSGRVVARYKSPGEAIAGMIGFRSTAVYKQERATDIIRMYEYAYRTSRKYYINKIAGALNQGDRVKANRLIQEANQTPIPGASNLWKSHFITDVDISRAIKRRGVEISDRGLSKLHRQTIRLAIPEAFGD